MNDRERFVATMHFKPRDRAPLFDFSFWDETLPEWRRAGLPERVTRENAAAFFGLDASLGGGARSWETPCNSGLCPEFERLVLDDRGDHELVQQEDGVRVLRKKSFGSIPHPEHHVLVDRGAWEEHYKWRLDPKTSERYPNGGKSGSDGEGCGSPNLWDEHVEIWRDPQRTHPIILPGCSLYGWLRNWMGVENVSMLVYDDPVLFEEMVATIADCNLGVLERIFATGGRFEACAMWEDMCYNAGPLLSPAHFSAFLVPHYKRITALLRRHGVDVVWVDCDGRIDQLLPLWLDAGVNTMFPIEVGTWHADAIKLREKYGRELLLMGGFDKHILARSKDAVTREIERLAPCVEEGGFIPMPDHRVPPDVPFENYVHYCEMARVVWGHGVNLKPKHIAAPIA